MARDDFSRLTIDRMAKRVGMRCSNPNCRRPTAGPDAEGGTTNLGVAAHITAASVGGPRYDRSLTTEQRSDITNGIWLCQDHAKLIDDDELSYPPSTLREWKETSEHMAALEARGYVVAPSSPFPSIERKMPNLVREMREDLTNSPLTRQFILLSKRATYNPGSTPFFTYFFEDHPELLSKTTILEHGQAIYSVKFNSVDRFNFTEPFVAYLIGEGS